MTKRHFIALADMIRACKHTMSHKFTPAQIAALADFCQSQNPRFMRDRWMQYIAGECGSNGGKVKGGTR